MTWAGDSLVPLDFRPLASHPESQTVPHLSLCSHGTLYLEMSFGHSPLVTPFLICPSPFLPLEPGHELLCPFDTLGFRARSMQAFAFSLCILLKYPTSVGYISEFCCKWQTLLSWAGPPPWSFSFILYKNGKQDTTHLVYVPQGHKYIMFRNALAQHLAF